MGGCFDHQSYSRVWILRDNINLWRYCNYYQPLTRPRFRTSHWLWGVVLFLLKPFPKQFHDYRMPSWQLQDRNFAWTPDGKVCLRSCVNSKKLCIEYDSWYRSDEIGLMCVCLKSKLRKWLRLLYYMLLHVEQAWNSLALCKQVSLSLPDLYPSPWAWHGHHGRHGHGLWIHDCVHGRCDRGHHDHHGHRAHHDHVLREKIPGRATFQGKKDSKST